MFTLMVLWPIKLFELLIWDESYKKVIFWLLVFSAIIHFLVANNDGILLVNDIGMLLLSHSIFSLVVIVLSSKPHHYNNEYGKCRKLVGNMLSKNFVLGIVTHCLIVAIYYLTIGIDASLFPVITFISIALTFRYARKPDKQSTVSQEQFPFTLQNLNSGDVEQQKPHAKNHNEISVLEDDHDRLSDRGDDHDQMSDCGNESLDCDSSSDHDNESNDCEPTSDHAMRIEVVTTSQYNDVNKSSPSENSTFTQYIPALFSVMVAIVGVVLPIFGYRVHMK